MEEKISDTKAKAMVFAEVVNLLQAQNVVQKKIMMAMFEKLLTSVQAPAAPVVIAPPTPQELPPLWQETCQPYEVLRAGANKALRLEKLAVHQDHCLTVSGG